MGKIHLLFKKEEIDEAKIQGKIAVVFDVLLATSTITVGLHLGAKEVIPVKRGEEAIEEAERRDTGSCLLVGENEGNTIEGFLDPVSFLLNEEVEGKTVILSTTNGTVAIRKAACAKKVFICSLLNGRAVADRLLEEHQDETIIIVCSGSSGSFCLEDFYGAGYLIDCLISGGPQKWTLTDSALAALFFYQGSSLDSNEVLQRSSVGKMIQERGFSREIEFVSQQGIISLVPCLDKDRVYAADRVEEDLT